MNCEWKKFPKETPELGKDYLTYPHYRILGYGNDPNEPSFLEHNETDTTWWDWPDNEDEPIVVRDVTHFMELPEPPKK